MTGGAQTRPRRRGRVYDAVVVLVAVAAVLAVGRLMQSPSFVDEINVANPTAYHVRIDVTSGDRDGWTAVGTAKRASASTFEQVIDQGDVWVFRFSAQGRDGGEMRVPRSRLEADDWRIAIPEEVGRTLASRGAPPPP